ncbi:FAD-binding oxidoreductase [Desulforhopalus singaporensis]|uniref:Uncharacterized protein n=1 Tax=Desulforhopalus singaporensis TaxID=91360 RepID=A0A1H0TMZ4_9BACT|nr:FAD-binding oxidoreductase [Desulforhopalus singaporensis]SDP55135.1 hypothetical protein SAMN05660330_03157 [Desulforhopalus singaporensis]
MRLVRRPSSPPRKLTRQPKRSTFSIHPIPGVSVFFTIGGNVAENGGGLRGLKCGVTKDYARIMEVVLPQATLSPSVTNASKMSPKLVVDILTSYGYEEIILKKAEMQRYAGSDEQRL